MTETRTEYHTGRQPTEGWGWPSDSYHTHYFENGRSLCGKWEWDGGEFIDLGSCPGCLNTLLDRQQEEIKHLRLQVEQLDEALEEITSAASSLGPGVAR